MSEPLPRWELVDRFAETRSRWVTLIGEHLRTTAGTVLEYWRVERASSAIVLAVHRGALLLPPPSYRPGVGQATLDFAGGRVEAGDAPARRVPEILARELGVAPEGIARVETLNPAGWAVDSSFSNQRVYGFIAHLRPEAAVSASMLGAAVPLDAAAIDGLLQRLECLQCRAVLLEWRRLRAAHA